MLGLLTLAAVADRAKSLPGGLDELATAAYTLPLSAGLKTTPSLPVNRLPDRLSRVSGAGVADGAATLR